MIFSSVVTQALTGAFGGLATSLWHVFLGRFFFEFRAFAYTQVLVSRWFDKKKGTALGMVATGMPIGTLILTPVSQYLILAWDWRITMFFWGGVMFIIILALSFFIRDYPQDKGYAPDGGLLDKIKPVGSIAGSESGALKAKQMVGSGLLAAMKAASFWFLAITQLICGIGCGFLMTHIVIFTTDAGFPDMIAASMLSAQAGVNLVALLLTGHLSDRMARNRVLALTHFMRCLSFVVLVSFVLIRGNSLWMLYLAMAFFGFGWFTTAPLSSGLVADIFGSFRMGTILGFMWAGHMLGMAIGAYAGGAIYELTGSYYLFFIIQGVLEFIAAGFALFIRRKSAYRAAPQPA